MVHPTLDLAAMLNWEAILYLAGMLYLAVENSAILDLDTILNLAAILYLTAM